MRGRERERGGRPKTQKGDFVDGPYIHTNTHTRRRKRGILHIWRYSRQKKQWRSKETKEEFVDAVERGRDF